MMDIIHKFGNGGRTMRMSQKQMDINHERIVKGAARLFREQGVKNTSVADAMGDAGMTHGGFYRHFKSKDELVVAALKSAFDESQEFLSNCSNGVQSAPTPAHIKDFYLSDLHVANPGLGCPMPAIASEMPRESSEAKLELGVGFRRLVNQLCQAGEIDSPSARDAAMREAAMLVGAVLIARATDAHTAAEILRACKG